MSSDTELIVQVKNEVARAWDATSAELADGLGKSVTVAFLGSASSGKDSAIRALFGLDFGDVSPIPGSTVNLRVARLDEAGQVLIVNAPGFGDIRAEVDAIARKVLDSLDIIVYLVNCEGGATIDEKRDLDMIRATGRPVLVCLNKIDLIRVAERGEFIAATTAQLGMLPADVVVCAFDPLPQLSETPIGVEYVIGWIERQLQASGKALLFAKHLRNKAAACEPLIQTAARNAALIGAIPIPGADLAGVTAVQVKLIRDIAEVHGVPMNKDLAMFLIGEILSGGMRGFVRWGIGALKAAGFIPGTQIAEAAILGLSSMVAGATTYGIGQAALRYIQSGAKMDSEALRNVFDLASWDWKKLVDGKR